MTTQELTDKLQAFKSKKKFSYTAWAERGLNPSSDELSSELSAFFDVTTDKLIDAVNNGLPGKQLLKILRSELSLLKQGYYDTEEKEFICDVFYELSIIVNVDFRNDLNKWLYGAFLTGLMKIRRSLKPERIIETLLQPCTKCNIELETPVTEKDDSIPETTWFIVKCQNCGELNLLSFGPGVKQTKNGNYQWVESLHMADHSYQQALNRLEQLRVFRK